MKTLTYTAARNKLAWAMETVTQTHEPMMITRKGHDPIIMISCPVFEKFADLGQPYRAVVRSLSRKKKSVPVPDMHLQQDLFEPSS